MNFDFSGLRVLVTGGTRGIGKQVAQDISSLGGEVTITGTKDPGWSYKNINFFKVDFLDSNEVIELLSYIKDEKFDVCINNAGINRISSLFNIENKDWDDVLRVNLTVPSMIMQAISENMKVKMFGRIVNISSIWGSVGKEKRCSYSSSKFGIRGLTVSAAAELAKFNILVNTVSPGFTLTDLTRESLSAEEIVDICSKIPARRMAETCEISSPIVFLSSRENTYISGQNIIVDGGYSSV